MVGSGNYSVSCWRAVYNLQTTGGGGSHVPVSSFCDVFPWPCPSFLYQQKTGHCDVFSKHSEKLKDFSTTIGLKRIVDNDF